MTEKARKSFLIKKLREGEALVLTALAFFMLPTCKIGLGKAVDTQVPEIEIQQPTNNTAPILGAFNIKGICKDDGEIKRITIKIIGLDSGKNDSVSKEFVATTKGNPSRGGMTWECLIDPFTDKTLVDGSYEIRVTAEDTFQHTSTDKITFNIDNTPPILVLTRPPTIFSDDSPDTYGRDFTITGQAADDSDVGKIEIKIYGDKDCSESSYKDTITLTKIPPTIDMTVMQWSEDGASKYNKLYGDDVTMGDKSFYCKLVVYDEARPCPDEGENAGKGNSTDYYFLYNDIFDDVLSEFKLTQVYSILNGTYSDSESNRAAEESKIARVKEVLGDGAKSKRITKGLFALNPMNNPKFLISGYDPLKELIDNGGNIYYDIEEITILNGSDLTIQVSSGLDKIPLDNDTIGIYAVPVDNKLKRLTDKNGNPLPKIELFKPACSVEKDAAGNRKKLITDAAELEARSSLIKLVGSYDRTITINLNEDIEVLKNYIIEVVGCDTKDNVFYNHKNNYGFRVISDGAPPTLKITKPDAGLNYIGKNETKLIIKGTSVHSEGTPKLTIKNGGSDPIIENEDTLGEFTKEFDIAELVAANKFYEDQNTLSIVSEFDGRSTTVQRIVIYDKIDPTINITSVSPVVDSYSGANGTHTNCVNGTIKITGTMFDNTGIENASYVVKGKYNDSGVEKDVIIKDGVLDKTKSSFTITADTTKGTITLADSTTKTITRKDNGFDECDLIVEITAVDVAGNKTIFELKTKEDKPYYICQNSDKPTITPTNFDVGKLKDEIGIVEGNDNSVNLFGTTSNNVLNATLEDDDGIKNVYVTYKKDGLGSGTTIDVLKNGTSTSFPLRFPLTADGKTTGTPLAEGKYEITIRIEDENITDPETVSHDEITTWIGVSAGAPKIKIDKSSYQSYYSSNSAATEKTLTPKFTVTSGTLKSVSGVMKKSGVADVELAPTLSGGSYSTIINLNDKYGDAAPDGDVTITFTATDIFNQKTESDTIEFTIDNTKPDIPNVSEHPNYKYKLNSVDYVYSAANDDAYPWYNTDSITFEGFYHDEGSGIAAINYWVSASTNKNDATDSGVFYAQGTGQTGFYKSTPISIGVAKSGYILIEVVDGVGNKSVMGNYRVKVDTQKPTLVLVKVDGKKGVTEKLVNKKSPVTVIVDAKDEGDSKLESVKYGDINGTLIETGEDAGKYSIIIQTGKIVAGNVLVTATDNAGNETTENLFRFKVDDSAPSVELIGPSDADTSTSDVDVNKTITLSGTAIDGNTLSKVPVIYYSKNSPGATITEDNWETIKSSKDFAELSGAFPSDLSSFNYNNWTTEPIDTIKFTDNTTYYFVAEMEDVAGNKGYSNVLALKVNQNSDRPVISIPDVSSDGKTLFKDKKINGSISDDDGEVQGLWFYEGAEERSAKPTTASDNGWTKVDITNNSWSIEVSEDQGGKSLWFYCIDANGNSFSQKATEETSRLYFKYKGSASTTKTDTTAAITFSLDTVSPVIKELYVVKEKTSTPIASYGWGNVSWSKKDNEHIGGLSKYLYGKVEVEEETGMPSDASKAISVNLKTDVAIKDVSTAAEKSAGKYTYIFGPIDVSSMPSESTTLTVTAIDGAARETPKSKIIIIDNEAPTVTISYPSVKERVTSSVTISGLIQDNTGGSGAKELYYVIPTVAQQTTPSTISESDWKKLSSTASWAIDMTGTLNTETNYLGYYANDTYAIKTDDLWKIPLYFKTVDVLGNAAVYTKKNSDFVHYVMFDAEIGKPYTEIIYPQNNATVGGSITISGSATDDLEVKEVRVQIDVNGDGNYDAADYATLTTNTEIVASSYLKGDASNWYLLANGTNSWKLPIKTSGTSGGTPWHLGDASGKINIQAKSLDENGISYTRNWVSISVTIDAGVPTISNLKLKQKDGDTILVERDYVSGMYISNKNSSAVWYLEGTLTDDVGVEKLVIENVGNDISFEYTEDYILENTGKDTASRTYISNFSRPLSNASDEQIYSRIKATDGNSTVAQMDIIINIDSTAPSMYKTDNTTAPSDIENTLRLTSSEKTINKTNAIQNSNIVFSFGDTVLESGSGLDYIAFYFKRTGTSTGTRIYDPMIKHGTKTADGYANQIAIDTAVTSDTATNGKIYINSDGLVVRYISGTRGSTSQITKSDLINNANIRKGGLIKIGGTYRLISDFAKATGTITFSPEIDTSYTTAEVVLAQVVNHQITEGPTGENYTIVQNDDGDGMIESITRAGTSYKWTASIFSDNIPDGPIELHVVAIDKAGNLNHGCVETSVQNSRPRIAKVLIGTDLDNNGTVEYYATKAPVTNKTSQSMASGTEYGEFNYYKTLGTTDADSTGSSIATLETIVDDECNFTVKNNFVILPEFVSGNGDIYYLYEVGASAGKTQKTGTQIPLTAKSDLTTGTIKVGNKIGSTDTIEKHITDKGGIVLENSALTAYDDGTVKYFAFTFWDSTEERTPGVDSQYALINIPVIVDVTDNAAPKAEIKPFYWKGKGKGNNSVQWDNAGNALGHIELEGDLNSTITTALGNDPKVSGKIVIEGTAFDETRLTGLTIKQTSGSTTTTLANVSYTNGSWGTAAGLTITDTGITQAGHNITWKYEYETPAAAQKDLKITVTATDGKNNASTPGSTQTTAATNTGYYQMDVVPYITKISTTKRSESGLKDNNIRAASGKYSVIKGDGSDTGFVTVTGYNLSGTKVLKIVKDPTNITETDTISTADVNSTSFTFGNDLSKSGYLELSVNDVRALNNINKKEAKGEYENVDDIVADYPNMYNREPDLYKTQNIQLTDDRYIRVFDMKQTNVMNGYYPTMIMDRDDPVFGYINQNGGNSGNPTANVENAGDYYPQNAMPQRGKFNGSTGATLDKEFLIKGSNWDQMGMAKDDAGRYYHATLYNRDDAGFSVIYDRYAELYTDTKYFNATQYTSPAYGWGAGVTQNNFIGFTRTGDKTYYGDIASYEENNAIALESTSLTKLMLGRYQYPKLIAKGNSVIGHAVFYMTYFDAQFKNLIFRNFQLGTDLTGTTYALGSSGTASDGGNYTQKTNFRENYSVMYSYDNDGKTVYASGWGSTPSNEKQKTAYNNANNQNNHTWNTGRLDVTGSNFSNNFAMGVTSDNHVVIVWYDETNAKLKMVYSSVAVDGSSPETPVTWTTSTAPFPANVGSYVSMTIDGSNGIHIAALDANDADLAYIYLSSYNSSTLKHVTVDQAFSVGSWTQIKVQGDYANGYVPYIAYYNMAEIGFRDGIKLAYFNDKIKSASDVTAGVDSNGYTTGNWEYMTVPAITPPQGGSTMFQNVCLDFDSAGRPVVGYLGTNIEFGKALSE